MQKNIPKQRKQSLLSESLHKPLSKEKTLTNNSDKKIRLLKRSPYCHWCGRKVFLSSSHRGKEVKNNTATIDHIFAKGDERRDYPDGKRIVLCCNSCNQKRGDMRPEEWVKFRTKPKRSRIEEITSDSLKETLDKFYKDLMIKRK